MKTTLYILICIFITSLFSCSISFEKRRYRPGYHIDVTQHPQRLRTHKRNSETVKIDPFDQRPVLISSKSGSIELGTIKKVPSITEGNKLINDHSSLVKTENINIKKTTLIFKDLTSKKMSRASETKQSNSLKGRKIAAWILGGLAIALFLLFIIFAIVWTNAGGFLVGLALPSAFLFFAVPAIILAIIALCVRFIGVYKEKD